MQVIELNSSQGPEAGLDLFSNVQYFRVLVCGGDGTVAWVLDAIERYNYDSPPPVAVLPLGTGNDLSRVLHWGGGFSVIQGKSALSTFLNDIDRAAVTMLDQWKVNVTNGKSGGSEVKSKFMMNYLGNLQSLFLVNENLSPFLCKLFHLFRCWIQIFKILNSFLVFLYF